MDETQKIIPEIIQNGDLLIDRTIKNIPLSKIVELKRKNLSLQQIADILQMQ